MRSLKPIVSSALARLALALAVGALGPPGESAQAAECAQASASGGSPVRTLEDIYGPTGESFRAALGFRVFEGDTTVSPTTSYGVGVDDMRFAWREYKLVEDATDCATSGSCASIVVDAGRAYGGVGTIHVTIVDTSPYGAFAPFDRNDCNRNGSYLDGVDDGDCDDDGTPDVTLLVSSIAEAQGEPLVANRTAAAIYQAEIPYSSITNVAGVLWIRDAGANAAEATVRYEDRWDGGPSGDRCRNSANPVEQGFLSEGIEIELVTGALVVISHRLLETNGDLDGFADTNETFDLYLTVANRTTQPLTNVVVQVSSSDPRIDCVLSGLAVIPSLDPKSGTNAIREIPTPIRLHVAASADRAGAVPAVACTAGQCSNGAGPCALPSTCPRTVFDDYSARLDVTIASDSFDVESQPQHIDLDLDLNSSGPVTTTATFVEGFEGGLGNFTFQNLDANIASNSASNGARCQYNDPDYPNSNSYGDTECYLGFQAGQSPTNSWHGHTTAAVDGGRAYLGVGSLHYGRHSPGNPGADTYDLSQMDAVRTKSGINLAARVCANDPAPGKRSCNSAADCAVVGGGPCTSASPQLSFKHQISLPDSRSNGVPYGQGFDRAVLHAQVVGLATWQKLNPYENVYDHQGTDNFSNCLFDPTDDGNDEDDYFDPQDPARRFGPSSTCFPEFAFGFLGDTDAPFGPKNIGNASDGPGLPGSLGIGTWVESKVDLARFRGRSIQLRFLLTSIKVSDVVSHQNLFMWNPSPVDDGWYVDDVRVTQTLGATPSTTSVDSANNAALPGCPASPCSSLAAALAVWPGGPAPPGTAVELRAAGSAADRCVNGTLLYRFFLDADASGGFSPGDAILRPYSAASVHVEAPAATTRYGVTVQCSSGGAGSCAGADATVLYTPSCTPPPPVLDSALWWTQVRWTSRTKLALPPFGQIVDLVRGDLGLLRSTGSFSASAPVCIANDAAQFPFVETAVPGAGSGFYYLLRGQVVCNDSTSYRTFSTRENPGSPGQRDGEITACPP